MIHAATMVTAGVYLLARMFPLISGSTTVAAAIAATGGVTAFYGASCALAQRDLKRVLAFSTISQIGYMVLGVGAGAVTASIFHLLVHAFFKALLFLGAGCVITAMHHEQDIFRMGGLRRTLPLTFWPFLAGAASLAGLPLTGGFFSKDGIMAALWLKGGALYLGLYLLALLTALLTAFYSFRMVYLVFFGANGQSHLHRGNELRVMELVLIPLAFFSLFGGVVNLPAYLGSGFLNGLFAHLAGGVAAEGSRAEELTLQGVAGALALAGLLGAHLRYGGAAREERLKAAALPVAPLTAFLLNGWYFDRLYHACLVHPYRLLARLLWERVDEGAIDDTLDRLATGLGCCGTFLGSWSTGRVSVYICSFAAGGALILCYLAWLSL
jgi:NADH-quinone oxidoreductase subunit L